MIIDKSIKLIGENNETTIIDGSRSSENVIEIDSSNVIFKDFTIRNSPDYCWGVFSNGDNVSIINNIIDHNSGAVFILGCLGVKIFGNIISRNYLQAIELYDTSNAMISKNTITKHYTPYIGIGVNLFRSNNNTVFNNTILDNSLGIVCGSSNSNKFYANKITHCQSDALYLSNSTNNEITSNILFGRTAGISIMYYSDYNIISLNNISSSLMESVYIENSIFNEIHHNNILKKTESAEFINGFKNNWDENFWYKPRFFPKPITGFYYVNNLKRFIPLITFDWHPAKEPYDIPGMN